QTRIRRLFALWLPIITRGVLTILTTRRGLDQGTDLRLGGEHDIDESGTRLLCPANLFPCSAQVDAVKRNGLLAETSGRSASKLLRCRGIWHLHNRRLPPGVGLFQI